MVERERSLLEDGLSDKVTGLEGVYLFYLVPLLVLALLPFIFLYSLFRSSWALWPSALLLILLAATLTLMLLSLTLKANKGIATIGFFLSVLIWILFIATVTPSPLQEILLLVGLFILVLTFFGGLFIVGGFLLPFPPSDPGMSRAERWSQRLHNHWTAFKILMDYLSGESVRYPYWVVTDEPREEDKIEQRGKGSVLADLAIGNGIILSDCDHAIAVSSGLKFKGVQGPGLILTGFAERPMRTLDLRPQLRAFTVQALTRDGIQVKVLAFTPFQIDRGDQQPRLGEPFPYRKSAAFRAVHSQMMELPENREHPHHTWDELPKVIGTRILQDILSRYRFDELYEYDPGEELPRARIAREFRERLKEKLEPLGIQLIGGGISNLLPVKDEVLKERIRNWRAEWVRRILVKQAEGQRERLWRIEQARAEAQANLILTLGERLAELDRSDAPVSPDKVIDHFLQVLGGMVQQPMIRRYLPRETPDDLRRLGDDVLNQEET